jgi:subtilisin family serine protease
MAFKLAKQRSTILSKTIFRGKIKEMSFEISKIFNEEYEKFFRSNPNSVFVLAAGNETRDLGNGTDHSANIQADNIIKVTAIDSKGKVASFSNFSSSYVDIATYGTGVYSALVGGGEMHMSGTSQAAPNVANALAEIFELNPHLSASGAIAVLYEKRSISYPSLSNAVANGRVLLGYFSSYPISEASEASQVEDTVASSAVMSCKTVYLGH